MFSYLKLVVRKLYLEINNNTKLINLNIDNTIEYFCYLIQFLHYLHNR